MEGDGASRAAGCRTCERWAGKILNDVLTFDEENCPFAKGRAEARSFPDAKGMGGDRMMVRAAPILIVEDSPTVAQACRDALVRLERPVETAETLAKARAAVRRRVPALVLLDVKLPDGEGLALLDELARLGDRPPVVVMTAHGSVQLAVEAMRRGALDFLVKPFDETRLLTTVRNALEKSALERKVRHYEWGFREEGFCGLIGRSLAMQAVYRIIESASRSKASVFITGESGTGKELAAEAIHRLSSRADKPFVALNCAAIPKDLLESELFGHRKGAFTGAVEHREGAALRADGGTLFLDELCELAPRLQSKLLRFIQTGVVQPVGSDETVRVDVRFVAATNRDPLAEVEAGRLREDLYYRLHVIPVEMPPLRERGDDIALLARHFLSRYAREEGKPFQEFSPEALAILRAYHWPGNVRQLQNVIQQVVVLHDGEVVTPEMLPASLRHATGRRARIAAETAESREAGRSLGGAQGVKPLWLVEKEAIEAALAACDGSVPKAAALLEVSPSTLYRKLQAWEESGAAAPPGKAAGKRPA